MKMQVVVWADDGEDVFGLADQLQRRISHASVGVSLTPLQWTTSSQAQSALSSGDDTRYLVLFETAQYAVARQCALMLPNAGLAEWAKAATDLLALYRRNRSKLLIISPFRLVASRDAAQKVLEKHLRIPELFTKDLEIDLIAPPQWAQSLAVQAATQNPTMRRLAGELDAVMLPIPVRPAEPDAATVEILGQELVLQELKKELGQASITHAQQAKKHVKERAALEQKLARLENHWAEQAAYLEHTREKEACADARNALLLKQLEDQQAELKTYFVKATKLEIDKIAQDIDARTRNQALVDAHVQITALTGQLETLETNLRLREEEVKALHASTSWKITAPMRSVKNTLRGHGKQEDT